MKIITVSGKAESGKDYTAKKIKLELENYGYNTLICHYADLLKYICKQFFEWDGKKDENGRTLLQTVGTDTIRKQNPNYWVEFIINILTIFPNEWDFVIIPDTRFPNEIELMKENFDTIAIQVKRPNYTNHLSEEQRQHISETALDDFEFDYTLINPGDEDGMKYEVKMFVDHIFDDLKKINIIEKIKEKL